jgi:hypothetical protein
MQVIKQKFLTKSEKKVDEKFGRFKNFHYFCGVKKDIE